jgi:hypothetical protein
MGIEMTTIRLWAVLGEGNVGKSTTIGHLVGDFGPGANGLRHGRGGGSPEILLRGGGYLTIHPRRQSLQEAGKSPQQAVREITRESSRSQRKLKIRSNYFNVLLALRTDQFRRMPRAHEYLSHFVDQRWQIESLVLFSSADSEERIYRQFGVPICYIDDSRAFPILQMVGRVRNHFCWA